MNNTLEVILGMKGSGKTSLCLNKTRGLDRVLFWDYLREYNEGYVVSDPEEFIKVLIANHNKKFRIIYRPDDSRTIDDHFEIFSRAVYSVPNVTVVIEELDLISGSNEMSDGLKKLINYGRHRGINFIGLSRRAHRIPRDLTANADFIYSFYQQEPRDIKYLSEFMGQTAAERVNTLSRDKVKLESEFLKWETGGESTIGVIQWTTKDIVEAPIKKLDIPPKVSENDVDT